MMRDAEICPALGSVCPSALKLFANCQSSNVNVHKVLMRLSGKRLDDDDLLVDAETVKHAQQVLSTARHLPFHRQAEVFLHSFGDSTSHSVMPEDGKKKIKLI